MVGVLGQEPEEVGDDRCEELFRGGAAGDGQLLGFTQDVALAMEAAHRCPRPSWRCSSSGARGCADAGTCSDRPFPAPPPRPAGGRCEPPGQARPAARCDGGGGDDRRRHPCRAGHGARGTVAGVVELVTPYTLDTGDARERGDQPAVTPTVDPPAVDADVPPAGGTAGASSTGSSEDGARRQPVETPFSPAPEVGATGPAPVDGRPVAPPTTVAPPATGTPPVPAPEGAGTGGCRHTGAGSADDGAVRGRSPHLTAACCRATADGTTRGGGRRAPAGGRHPRAAWSSIGRGARTGGWRGGSLGADSVGARSWFVVGVWSFAAVRSVGV